MTSVRKNEEKKLTGKVALLGRNTKNTRHKAGGLNHASGP